MHGRCTLVVTLAVAALAATAGTPAQGEPLSQLGDGVGKVTGRAGDTFRLGGRECRLIPVPAAAPFGRSRCGGVKPGALVETRLGFCTMNFMFRDGDGRRYIATAGHCVLNGSGERQWRTGGPVARNGNGRIIGQFRYAIHRSARDFGLIRLRKGVRASPRMCHFGGPTGVSFSRTRRTVALQLYGDGVLIGDVTPARILFTNGMRNPHHLFAKGVTISGDSGAPVTVRGSGRAVGLHIGTGFAIRAPRGDAGALITRLPPRERRAERVTGERFEIVRARQR